MEPEAFRELAQTCMGCRLCGPKSAAVTWPALGYFPPTAKILLIGQNPAQPKMGQEKIEFKRDWEKYFDTADPIEYMAWYGKWLKVSSMARELEAYLGRAWLDSGLFAVTNAVRCRTFNNRIPSEDWMYNCKRYTQEVIKDFRYVVVMGSLARKQVRLERGPAPKVYLDMETDRYYLYIAHYVWRPKEGDGSRTAEKKTALKFVDFAINGTPLS